jgi:serine/threonine-protein kinase
MAIPFKLNPEPPKRQADDDPFLEFDSERPGVRPKMPSNEPLFRPEPPEPPSERMDFNISEPTLGLGQPQPRTSAISPAFAFALGVAGLVAAAVAYYQLSQVLASRAATSQARETATEPPAAAPVAAAPAAATSGRASTVPSRAAGQAVAPASATGTGRIDVASNPPGALVSLNGVARGLTPFILTGLPAGRHTIVVSRGSFSASRLIELDPGGATAVSVAIPASVVRSTPAPRVQSQQIANAGAIAPGSAGWLTLDLPIDVMVYQDGRLRGNSRDGRVMLPAGTQNVVLANTAYEYRETVAVTMTAGLVTRANVSLPTGYLSLNALPWAEVWVDGNAMGTTPLANLSLPIGSHEVLWRHPILGDRRQLVTVKAKTPANAGVDFTR